MIYNNFDKVISNLHGIAGSGLGIAKPELLSGNRNCSNINMSVLQLSIPDYCRTMFNSRNSISYHIAGYGQSNEEAITRVIGETVERYSYMSFYHLLKNRTELNSWDKLNETENVLPLELINIIDENDPYFKHLSKTEETKWIKLKNYCDGKDIYYPLLLVCQDSSLSKFYYPTMSTGTATHISYENALINSMIEQLQIHLFLTAWYSAKKMPVVDWKGHISASLQKIFDKTFDMSSISITVLDYGLPDIGFYNYVAIIKNRKGLTPYCAIGIQGGFNAEQVLLRSVMEAASIYVNLQNFYMYKNDEVSKLNINNVQHQYNLDAPFLYWSNNNDITQKEDFLALISDYENKITFEANPLVTDKEQLETLLKYYKQNLKFFSVMDITAPEVRRYGYVTVRVIAPELVAMNLPALTYKNHPYFINNGGIKNGNFTHPLP